MFDSLAIAKQHGMVDIRQGTAVRLERKIREGEKKKIINILFSLTLNTVVC
jgi:hypothetical protein